MLAWIECTLKPHDSGALMNKSCMRDFVTPAERLNLNKPYIDTAKLVLIELFIVFVLVFLIGGLSS